MKITSLALALSLFAPLALADITHIENAELEKLIAAKAPVIDIRTESEWRETGVIAGSRLLTFFDEKGRADPAAWLEHIKPLAPADKPVVIICRSGNRTQAVAKFLSEQAGYKQVYNVKYGLKGWLKDARPVTNAQPQLASCKPGTPC